MKYYFSSIIPKIASFSKKLDKVAAICDRKWTIIDDENEPTTYIFRDKKELLVVKGGVVKKAKWDVVNKDDIMIEQDEEILMFKQAFIDENIFVLNLFNTNNYLHLIDSEKVSAKTIKELENILNKRYFLTSPEAEIKNSIVENKGDVIPKTENKSVNEDKNNLFLWLFLPVVFAVAFVAFVRIVDKSKDQKEKSDTNQKTDSSATFTVPREPDVIYHISSNMEKFVKDNLENEHIVGMRRSLTTNSDEFSSEYDFEGTLKKTFPGIFDDQHLVFDANLTLGVRTYDPHFLRLGLDPMKNRFSGSLDQVDKILSIYKDCFDNVGNKDLGYGYNRNFCALMIGKIQKYILSGYNIKANAVAIEWFKKSASMAAYLNIASYYEQGIRVDNDPYKMYKPIVKKDLKEAVKWYKKAFAAGSDKAKQKLNLLSIEGYD